MADRGGADPFSRLPDAQSENVSTIVWRAPRDHQARPIHIAPADRRIGERRCVRRIHEKWRVAVFVGPNLQLRTKVGDRYVVEAMRAGGYNLGGEQSGHIVMTDYATTGDGPIAGLQFLSAMLDTGRDSVAP